MSYFDILYFLVFVPIVVIVYNIFPKKIRPLILCIASLVFYLFYSKFLIVFLLLSILSIYLSGRWMSSLDKKKEMALEQAKKEEKKEIKEKVQKKKRWILLGTILFNVAFLFFFKYLGFFTRVTNQLLQVAHVDVCFKIIKCAAPIGISFYTLQAISYLVDVYHEKFVAEKKFFKVMLYLSFFPTIVEGPITRFQEVSSTIYEGVRVSYHNFCFGYQRILLGLFKKIVIADRLNIFVKSTFDNFSIYSGMTLACSAIFYTILLYMEFSGTMDVVIGTAEIFGIQLPENFRQPFFSKNISEFWSRWHITLGTWFKDYVFYPVSLSKPVKKITTFIKQKKGIRLSSLVMGAIALFAVWSLNGLWHGAGYHFLFFGYYHFTLILLGNIFEPTIAKICEKLKIDRKKKGYHAFQIVKTSILVFIGELFFRANTLHEGFGMMKKILTDFSWKDFGELFTIGLDIKDYFLLGISLLVILGISILREKKVSIREKIASKPIYLRWSIYYLLILAIIIFGAYGTGYVPVAPIYADF